MPMPILLLMPSPDVCAAGFEEAVGGAVMMSIISIKCCRSDPSDLSWDVRVEREEERDERVCEVDACRCLSQ